MSDFLVNTMFKHYEGVGGCKVSRKKALRNTYNGLLALGIDMKAPT